MTNFVHFIIGRYHLFCANRLYSLIGFLDNRRIKHHDHFVEHFTESQKIIRKKSR